jgi:hypothetical protein
VVVCVIVFSGFPLWCLLVVFKDVAGCAIEDVVTYRPMTE